MASSVLCMVHQVAAKDVHANLSPEIPAVRALAVRQKMEQLCVETGRNLSVAGEQNGNREASGSHSSSLENAGAVLVQSLAGTESRLPAPIDLSVRWAQRIRLGRLRWENYDRLPVSVRLTNTGETVILSARWHPGERPSLAGGGPLGGRRYVLSHLHFHWGRTALDGSEHTVDGARMPLELHAVHFDRSLGDQESAGQVPGGLLCAVYLFRLQPSASGFFAPLAAGLGRVLFPGSHTELERFPLAALLHPFADEYFLYWGSSWAAASLVGRAVPMLWLVSRAQERLSFAQLKRFGLLLDRRMRRMEPSPSPVPTPLAPPGRHLFHVNPRTAVTLSTLSLEPPPKYSQAAWHERPEPTERQI